MSKRLLTVLSICFVVAAGIALYVWASGCCDDDACANGNMCHGGATQLNACNWQFHVDYVYDEYSGQAVYFYIRTDGGSWAYFQMSPNELVHPPCKRFHYNKALTANTDYEYYFSSNGVNYPAGTEDCPFFRLCVGDGCNQEPCSP